MEISTEPLVFGVGNTKSPIAGYNAGFSVTPSLTWLLAQTIMK